MNDNSQNAYYEDGEAGENLHESRLVRFSYREFIRWIAVLALFVVSLLALVNTNSDVKIITSEPDYKREFLFSIVLSFIEIVLINTTFFILAYAAPGVFKFLLRKKRVKCHMCLTLTGRKGFSEMVYALSTHCSFWRF